ncbi:MAG TPA: DUF2752 domain-containing protein [Streptosporangiaceae bacterium]|nr:DUF2752 domain-containing protein [Streptosporangiaceae bacterium]
MTTRWRGLRPMQNVLARLTAVTLGLLALAWLPRPHTVCPLLMLTGVPCPFCGGTHAGVDLGQGHPAAALRASPLAVCGAVVMIILPVLRTTSLAERWRQLPAKTRSTVSIIGIVAALAVSEVWQLGRFGLL